MSVIGIFDSKISEVIEEKSNSNNMFFMSFLIVLINANVCSVVSELAEQHSYQNCSFTTLFSTRVARSPSVKSGKSVEKSGKKRKEHLQKRKKIRKVISLC